MGKLTEMHFNGKAVIRAVAAAVSLLMLVPASFAVADTAQSPEASVESTDGLPPNPRHSWETSASKSASSPDESGSLSLQASSSPYWRNGDFYDGKGALFAASGMKVADISEWQSYSNGKLVKNIDWNTVKSASGVNGVILRVGYSETLDKSFAYNIKEVKRLGIPYGIYHFSYATNASEAEAEGQWVAKTLKSYGATNLAYPIFYDLESWSWKSNGVTHTSPSDPATNQAIFNAFASAMKQAGFSDNSLRVYTNAYRLQHELNTDALHRRASWVAQYGTKLQYPYPYNSSDLGWQYTDAASVAGISGPQPKVDMSAFRNPCTQGATSMKKPVYRLFNPNSAKHHYTVSSQECQVLVNLGWKFETIAFYGYQTGAIAKLHDSDVKAVFREYNPNDGNHNFTTSVIEHETLASKGWKTEDIAWLAPLEGTTVYRLYNAYNGEHLYTTGKNEYDTLPRYGWRQEGTAWTSL